MNIENIHAEVTFKVDDSDFAHQPHNLVEMRLFVYPLYIIGLEVDKYSASFGLLNCFFTLFWGEQ